MRYAYRIHLTRCDRIYYIYICIYSIDVGITLNGVLFTHLEVPPRLTPPFPASSHRRVLSAVTTHPLTHDVIHESVATVRERTHSGSEINGFHLAFLEKCLGFSSCFLSRRRRRRRCRRNAKQHINRVCF